MSDKNKQIREFLEQTTDEQRSQNCFEFGKVLRVQIDPDSPLRGVEFEEGLYVSIYNPKTDTMMQFSVQVESVSFEENALSGQ